VDKPNIKPILLQNLKDALRADGVAEDKIDEVAQELLDLAEVQGRRMREAHGAEEEED